MEMDANGQGESRLDRIERLLEKNEEAHAEFIRDYQLLLKAQVVMADAAREQHEWLESFEKSQEKSHAKLDEKMLETTEKLNALIAGGERTHLAGRIEVYIIPVIGS